MKEIPTTRYHLQKLTKQIEKLEQARPFSRPHRGTGIRRASADFDYISRCRAKASDLKKEKKLVEAGLLEIEEKGSEVIFLLTNDGVIRALKDRIILEKKHLFDDEKCFVMFDIPEDLRKVRREFRRFLKRAGFKRFQLSIWATEKDVANDLCELIAILRIEQWVDVVVGNKLEFKNGPTGPKVDQC